MKKYDPSLFHAKRAILELSQTKLAELCGVSRPTIRAVETGKTHNDATAFVIGTMLDELAKNNPRAVELFKRLEG